MICNLPWLFFTRLTSPLATLHNNNLPLRRLHQPQRRQIPSVHLEGLFHLNPRVREHTRMLPLTTSTLLSTRFIPPKPRLRPKPQTMCSAILISQRNCSRSRHPPHILPPLPTLETHIRSHRSHNTRSTRQVHRVSVTYLVLGSYILTCHLQGRTMPAGRHSSLITHPGITLRFQPT